MDCQRRRRHQKVKKKRENHNDVVVCFEENQEPWTSFLRGDAGALRSQSHVRH